MKKQFLAGIALTALFVGPVLAADLPARPAPIPYKAPPVIAIYSWTGCFVGGNGGGVWVNKDYTLVAPVGTSGAGVAVAAPASPTTIGATLGSHDASSWLGGGQIGCDYQFAGGWVIGIQGDYDGAYAGGTHINTQVPTVTEQSRTTSLGSVTGRLGYAWDRFLGYVRGGWAWERDSYLAYLTAAPGTGVGIASQSRTGWTVGVGGEYAFTNWISAFVEYDYYDFGTKTASLVNPTLGGATFENADIRERKSVVKAGINLRWGAGPVVARY